MLSSYLVCEIFMSELLYKFIMFLSGMTMSFTQSDNIPEQNFNFSCNGIIAETILPGELKYDLQAFKYLYESSYAGFDDTVSKGLNLENLVKSIEKKIENSDSIYSDTFAHELIDGLRPYMNDVHFCISTGKKYYSSYYSEEIYFSDVFLNKKDNNFYVEENNTENIPIGIRYTDSELLLFPYPVKEKGIFRLGCKSCKKCNSFIKEISFEKNTNKVNFARTRRNEHWDNTVYLELETDNCAYIKITDFAEVPPENSLFHEKQHIFKSYVKCAKKYRNKNNIILDLRGNYGGNDAYSYKFFEKLYGYKTNPFGCNDSNYRLSTTYLISKPVKNLIENTPILKKGLYYYLFFYEPNKKNLFMMISNRFKELKTPKFKGKIYILVNKNTASSGESSIQFCKQLFSKTNQVKLVGENSAGCVTYGNVLSYRLPNSGLLINMSSSKYEYFIDGKKTDIEGEGFFPDYWSTDEDVNQTLINLTGDRELENLDF